MNRTAMTEPIPTDGRLNRALRRIQENEHNAKLLAQLAIETGGSVAADRERHRAARVEFAPDPMDVRGIPAVGRNCPGRIAGTRPDAICDR